jgi:chromosome segregation ATPase
MPVVMQGLLVTSLGLSLWWAYAGEQRSTKLGSELSATRGEMAVFKMRAKNAAEQAQAEYNALAEQARTAELQAAEAYAKLTSKSKAAADQARTDYNALAAQARTAEIQAAEAYAELSNKAKAAAQQAQTQIQGLQDEFKALARTLTSEKQRLEASAEAFRKAAGEKEARLLAEVATLTQAKAALEQEVALQSQTIAARETSIVDLTRQKSATETALKNLGKEYELVAAQLNDTTVNAAKLREEKSALGQSKTAVEGELAKERSVIAEKELKLAELAQQKATTEASLKEMTAQNQATTKALKDMSSQYQTTASQLKDLQGKAADLAEMVQASEASRQAGAAEIAQNKTRISELQQLVENRSESIKALEADKSSLGNQVAQATTELNNLKSELTDTQTKAAAEAKRLAEALVSTEKAMEETRASLLQEMETSRAEAQAALARIEKLAASYGKNPVTAEKPNPGTAPASVAASIEFGEGAPEFFETVQQAPTTAQAQPSSAPQPQVDR